MRIAGRPAGTALEITRRVANPLPLSIVPPAGAGSDEPRVTASAAHSLAPTGARILVGDDNPRGRRATAAARSRIGFHVMPAEDGAPAIHLIETTPPDLAIVAFEMPTPGILVVKRLKELYGASVWVAVLSGDDADEMRSACFAAGVVVVFVLLV